MFRQRKKRTVPGLNATSTADISFILLVFFLVISSMDSNKGIQKQLPPPVKEQTEEPAEVDRRNVMDIAIGGAGSITVDGKPVEAGRLKTAVMAFVENCPRRGLHVIDITMLPESRYDDYFHVQDAVTSAYNALRDRYAIRKYGRHYADCTEYRRKQIARLYPQRIAEHVAGGGNAAAAGSKNTMEEEE